MSAITEFTTDVRHISGIDNTVADALSRPTVATTQLAVDYVAMAALQQTDKECNDLRTAITSLQLADVSIQGKEATLLCDMSQTKPRPYVPAAMRQEIFHAVHDISHPGINSTVKLVSERFI